MTTPDSVDKAILSERIEAELRKRIADGTYQTNSCMPSERQLTREFGVARGTVSRALDALQNEGLVKQMSGRGTLVLHPLDRLKTPLLGVVHWLSSDSVGPPFRGTLMALEGVQAALKDFGYRNEVVSGKVGALRAEWTQKTFGAAIFVDPHDEDCNQILELERRRVPTVVAKLESNIDVCATWVDHQEAGREAVRALTNLGHTRIALVAREPDYGPYGHVRQGYSEGLQEASLPLDESLIGVCEKTDALSGYFATKPLLALPDPPTAIVAGRDAIAEGICRAAQEAGLMVGHHVSVIGFDDLTWPQPAPFLTTFREPCYDMGVAAVKLLIDRIVNGWRPPEKRKFETPFVLRRSAGPPLPRTKTSAPGVRSGERTEAQARPSRE